MLYKQLLEVYELLDTASANGSAVRDYLLGIARPAWRPIRYTEVLPESPARPIWCAYGSPAQPEK